MTTKTAHFRFYEELNDFLPPEKHKIAFAYEFTGAPAVKDAIEAIGVPHPEVDLIVVNGHSVGFDYQLQSGDRVAVYPMFETLDISPILHLRPQPLRELRFILDVHLGTLARRLRLLGFDTLYQNDYRDSNIVEIAALEKRIILTRDRGILKNKAVTHGYWLRASDPNRQIEEVIRRFHLSSRIEPFCRCLLCNGLIQSVTKQDILEKLPERTASFYHEFYQCAQCGKVYWKGSHYKKMESLIDKVKQAVS